VKYSWPLGSFENNIYYLKVYGPNGFFREFRGSENDPVIDIVCDYPVSGSELKKLTGNINLILRNMGHVKLSIVITDNAYKTSKKSFNLTSEHPGSIIVPIDLSMQHHWYDFTISVDGDETFLRRYAGKVETGESGFTDPFMGRTI
jgi:phospholipase C